VRAPLSWLRDFAPIEGDVVDLAAALSQLGLVVEGVERVGEGLDRLLVGRVLATMALPQADRVQLVDVDTGDGDATRVVCGAFNFGPGDLVAFAPTGGRLPTGMEIGRRRVRGEWSEGMLCSPAELGLSDDHDGILVLAPGAAPGTPLGEALGIRPDVVFDLDVTPNRPDALSMAGVARDLAARLKVPFRLPDPPRPHGTRGHDQPVSVELEAPDLCPRFTATVLDGVAVGPSPPWLASRVTLAGMRPISNVVDLSNYVMLELGQPNHAYDIQRLGGRGLLVRRAHPGEVLVTLDGLERRLAADDCLICDATGAGVGIGGIMGGASSEISDDTVTVLLEAAWFSPLAIARTSKRLALRTEASVRFERGVDPHGVHRAVARFCELAADVGGGSVAVGPLDVRGVLPEPARVVVRTTRVNALLGTDLTPTEVAGYLEPIGFATEPAGDDTFELAVPPWRPDCEREIDVVEEVARHHGYERIPRTLPMTSAVGAGLTPYQRDRRRARHALVGAGLSEAWATSFVSTDDLRRAGLDTEAVEVANPLAQEESVLRTSLLPGLLRALATNHARRNPDVALFEVGHVFLPPVDGSDLPAEPENLAAAVAGRPTTEATRLWRTLVSSLGLQSPDLVADAPAGLHPTRSARMVAAGGPVGVLGEIDPDVLLAHDIDGPVAWFEVDLGALLACPRLPGVYRPVSRYPSSDLDLAFDVSDEVPAAAVESTLRQAAGAVLEDLWLFDVFRGSQLGEGRRSLAYRLRFAALDHTLTEAELAALRSTCIEAVESGLGARLRS